MPNKVGNRRWGFDDVMAEVGGAYATVGTAFIGTVGDGGGFEGPLQVLFEPGFVNAGVEVIPGERGIEGLMAIDVALIVFKEIPFPGFYLTVFPG